MTLHRFCRISVFDDEHDLIRCVMPFDSKGTANKIDLHLIDVYSHWPHNAYLSALLFVYFALNLSFLAPTDIRFSFYFQTHLEMEQYFCAILTIRMITDDTYIELATAMIRVF